MDTLSFITRKLNLYRPKREKIKRKVLMLCLYNEYVFAFPFLFSLPKTIPVPKKIEVGQSQELAIEGTFLVPTSISI